MEGKRENGMKKYLSKCSAPNVPRADPSLQLTHTFLLAVVERMIKGRKAKCTCVCYCL